MDSQQPVTPGKVVRVKVPATSANLGPGFDCLGMALELYNSIALEPSESLRITVVGEGQEEIPCDETNLVYRSIVAGCEAMGQPVPPLHITTHNEIPLARGLGSSSAAIIGGLVAINEYIGGGLSREAVVKLATAIEGHPDNVAPAAWGGWVISVCYGDDVVCLPLRSPHGLKAVLFVPDFPMPTAEARAVLPGHVSREDAVFNSSRVALLVASLARGQYEHLRLVTQDRLHQPYREKIFPAMSDLFAAALKAGALGVFLSGAGSTVLALANDNAEDVAVAFRDIAAELGLGGRAMVVGLASAGAEVTTSPVPSATGRRSIVVQKFGGSSVANSDRIRAVAARVVRAQEQGHQIVLVISAMGDTTDDLISLAKQITANPNPRELDLMLSTGEVVSCTLMAMALRELGCEAVALTGGQAGIRTDSSHSRARITEIDPQRVLWELAEGKIVIVAGFQGVTDSLDITTLGRGGSDTTAVALAARLQADVCEIYTDVDGVYTADPRVEPRARKLDRITYNEMLEMATRGAKVIHGRAVEMGAVYNIPIIVRSSFNNNEGTLISGSEGMEVRNKIRGIAHELDVAKVTLQGVVDQPGVAYRIFAPLADAGIVVDMVVQGAGVGGTTDISFTVARGDMEKAALLVQPVAQSLGAKGLVFAPDLAKVSIVGTGIQTHPGYAARMFGTLAEHNINIHMISTSDIRITCVIDQAKVREAVAALHMGFALDQPDITLPK